MNTLLSRIGRGTAVLTLAFMLHGASEVSAFGVNGASCDVAVDIVRMQDGSFLLNERTGMDGYALYRSTFFTDAAGMDAYLTRVQAEYVTCEWTEGR